MGEVTIQRHQVVATDMVYLLSVVGSVNMFTFQGFPPWTLLLSDIESKQTRLPNGTPAFDMTFKFAFNPYTHQAIFRPLYMRWEFVRGVLVGKFPDSVAIPKNPLSDINSRAKINPKATTRAWASPNPPREVPLAIDPRTGKPVRGGPGGVSGGSPAVSVNNDTGGGGEFDPPGDTGGGGDFGASLGASDGNANPNPPVNTNQNATTTGQVQVPYGSVPASSVEGDTSNLIDAISAPLSDDPNNPNYDPTDNWVNQSNILARKIAESVGVDGGTANADQTAAASGIEEDINQARIDGADWIDAYDNGVNITSTSGGTGNLEYDLALARIAHECGATLAPETREFLGLPPEAPGGSDGGLGADPGSAIVAGAGAAVASAAKAVNVGASNSVQQMSKKIFDVGLIYPICDFSPILWMQ
jgi:hypothetical protein